MIQVNKFSFVYILCPAYSVTGGPEALHQLCDKINSYGGKAKMVYLNYQSRMIEDKARTPIRYRHYKLDISDTIIDEKNNVLIVPELWPELLADYQNIQKCIWWLSVDYGADKLGFSFSDTNIFHLYQSWYARDYLLRNKAVNVYPLFDYLSISSTRKQVKKERIVIYNPKKGFETTSKIIDSFKDCNIEFKALQGYTRPELIKLMKKSMIYIDFGDHPGKDRMPREAAIYDNAIITSRLGSADYFEDLPIQSKYKFQDCNIPSIKDKIIHIINNFEKIDPDFNYYRRVIHNQEVEFTLQTVNLFCQVRGRPVYSFNLIPGIKSLRKILNDKYEELINKIRNNIPVVLKSKIKRFVSQ